MSYRRLLLVTSLLGTAHAAPPIDLAQTCRESPTCEEAGCTSTAGTCHVEGLEALASAPGIDRATLTAWASAASSASSAPPTHAGVLFVDDERALWSTSDPRSLYGHTTTWRDADGRTLLHLVGHDPTVEPDAFQQRMTPSRHRIERVAREHYLGEGFRVVEGAGDTRLTIELSEDPDARLHVTSPGVDAHFRVPWEGLGRYVHYRPGCPAPKLVRSVRHERGLLMLAEIPVARDVGDIHDAMIASDGRGSCGRTHVLLVLDDEGQLRIGDQVYAPVLDLLRSP